MSQIVRRHFSSTTLRALARKGVRVLSPTASPDASGSFINSSTVYSVDDNGTGRIWSFAQVLEAAR
jgi:hypothetical protein